MNSSRKKPFARPRKGEVRPDESAFLVRCDVRSFKLYSEYQAYLTMFEDAGWHHISGNMNGDIQYFERVRPDADEELFSDTTSRAERYLRLTKRYLFTLFTTLSCFMAFFLTNNFHIQNLFHMKDMYYTPGLWGKTGMSFWGAFLFETPFALVRGGVLHLIILLMLALELYGLGKAWRLYRRR